MNRRTVLLAVLITVAVLAVSTLLALLFAPHASAATWEFVTSTRQMGRDYCWNLYRGRVVSWDYIGVGYWEATCVGHGME